jgi:hypothetical protein
MKTINLFFDFEFTSLSPDAQPISLGIVSDETEYYSRSDYNKKDPIFDKLMFYAEFSDFDINRCADWVKKNVVSKLPLWNDIRHKEHIENSENGWKHGLPMGSFPEYFPGIDMMDSGKQTSFGPFFGKKGLRQNLKGWLKHFSDYQIQFIADCATYDWYWMVQLLAIWDVIGIQSKADMGFVPTFKTGLPTLPINISPVPFDLNDLIAIKKGITQGEAFEVDRFELLGSWDKLEEIGETGKVFNTDQFPKHNALFDAKVIKEIYNKLL